MLAIRPEGPDHQKHRQDEPELLEAVEFDDHGIDVCHPRFSRSAALRVAAVQTEILALVFAFVGLDDCAAIASMHLADVALFSAQDVSLAALNERGDELRNGLVDVAEALCHQQHIGVVVPMQLEPLHNAFRCAQLGQRDVTFVDDVQRPLVLGAAPVAVIVPDRAEGKNVLGLGNGLLVSPELKRFLLCDVGRIPVA